MNKRLAVILTLLISTFLLGAGKMENPPAPSVSENAILTGADQLDKYLPYLKGKRVAMLANQTTIIGKKHLVDSLKTLGVNIVKVFGPEHGFRGNLHGARTPVHELAGLLGAGVVAALLWWIDPLMAGVVFTAFAVHLAQDFVTGHSLPLNPADRTVVHMFQLSFAQKVAVDAAVILTSVALWIPYLRGRG